MKNVLITIEQSIPLDIMENILIKGYMDNLFQDMEEIIEKRYKLIIESLDSYLFKLITFDKIYYYFKLYFYKFIINTAIQNTFSGKKEYDLIKNILSLITKRNLENEIYGFSMVNAFIKVFRDLSFFNELTSKDYETEKIALLKLKFLNDVPYYTKKSKKERL